MSSSIILLSGGIGDAVAGELCEEAGIIIKKLAVRDLPRSGPPQVLLETFGIDRKAIVAAVKGML